MYWYILVSFEAESCDQADMSTHLSFLRPFLDSCHLFAQSGNLIIDDLDLTFQVKVLLVLVVENSLVFGPLSIGGYWWELPT